MANEENLISLGDRTTEEQRAIQIAGGIASGKARRERKKMREQAEMLLSLPFKDRKNVNGESVLENFKKATGIEDVGEIDNQMAMIISMWLNSMGNDAVSVSAFNSLRELVGEKKTDIDLNGGVNINFGGENDIPD